jgi:hypothetical protein
MPTAGTAMNAAANVALIKLRFMCFLGLVVVVVYIRRSAFSETGPDRRFRLRSAPASRRLHCTAQGGGKADMGKYEPRLLNENDSNSYLSKTQRGSVASSCPRQMIEKFDYESVNYPFFTLTAAAHNDSIT